MLHLYDGLNTIRRRIDTDPFGRVPRSIVTSMLAHVQGDAHVWVFEGRGALEKRRELFPDYKVRPDTMTSGFFALVDMIREALTSTNAIQIDVPGYEADDVIAQLTIDHFMQTEVKIHTTDRDLNQLLVLPNVQSTAKGLEHVESEHVRLYKTLVGDKSDRIPGLRGFGDQTWKGCNKQILLAAFKSSLASLYVEAGVSQNLAEKAVEERGILQKFWEIVGFMPVEGGVNTHLKVGQLDPHKADAILKQYYH